MCTRREVKKKTGSLRIFILTIFSILCVVVVPFLFFFVSLLAVWPIVSLYFYFDRSVAVDVVVLWKRFMHFLSFCLWFFSDSKKETVVRSIGRRAAPDQYLYLAIFRQLISRYEMVWKRRGREKCKWRSIFGLRNRWSFLGVQQQMSVFGSRCVFPISWEFFGIQIQSAHIIQHG